MPRNPTTNHAQGGGMAPDALTMPFVLRATAGRLARAGAAVFGGVAIDGRAVPAGGLFFAIRGERFDGHDFVAQAVEHGAAGVVVARGRARTLPPLAGAAVVEVDDTVRALGDLAQAHRLRLPLAVVGVAGSNGKTTTKELIAAILVAHAGPEAVLRTEGNLNNHLGVPLTLLRLRASHRYAVVEMGMSALGELAQLADLSRPDVGVVVSIGPEHLEHLGSVENVARAEGEIFGALAPAGIAVYPDGDERIAPYARASRALRQLRFGQAVGTPVRLLEARAGIGGTDVRLRLSDGTRVEARLAAVGLHNAMNAACAAAATSALGVPASAIAAGLSAARPAKHRSTVLDVGGRHVIDDCYNASPPSTTAALDTLLALAVNESGQRGRAIAVLGDMLELGPDELALHRDIGAHAARLGVDLLLAVGERSRATVEGAREAGLPDDRARHLPDTDSAAIAAAAASGPGDVILIKASRGARLERVLDELRTRLAVQQGVG